MTASKLGVPRRVRGTPLAGGIVWPRDRAPTTAAAWADLIRAGDRVVDLDDPLGGPGFCAVLFAAPRRVRAGGDGDVLVSAGAGLSSVTPPDEVPIGAIELAEAGRRRVVRPGRVRTPAELLPLRSIPVHRCRSLGVAPPDPEPPPQNFGVVSSRLGLNRPSSEAAAAASIPGRQARLASWFRQVGGWILEKFVGSVEPRLRQPHPLAPPWWRRARDTLRRLAGTAAGLMLVPLGIVATIVSLPAMALAALWVWMVPPAAMPRRISAWWDQLAARLSWVAALRDWAPLAWAWRWLGREHARMLEALIARFRAGDLLEALRWAIPLGGDGNSAPQGWFFGRMGPRTSFNLTQGLSHGAVAAQGEVISLLRRLYLDAHTRLDTEGDVERAAWVLAELLRDAEGAVRYLESRERLDLAATWAELLGRPTAEILRLWVRAGRTDRALEVGEHRQAVAEVLVILGRSAPDEAAALRRAWATARWESGARQGALTTLWPLREHDTDTLRRWAGRCLDEGGPGERWAMAAALALDPPGDPARVLAPTIAEGPLARRHLAEGLRTFGPPRAEVAAPVIRALFADITRDGPQRARAVEQARALLSAVDASELSLLRADLPSFPPIPAPVSPQPPTTDVTRHLPAAPGPGLRVHALGRVGDGTLLAALGELGVWVSRPGRAPAVWPWPAFSVVTGNETALLRGSSPSQANLPARVIRIGAFGGPEDLGAHVGAEIGPNLDSEGWLWSFTHDRLEAWRPGMSQLERVWTSGQVGRVVSAGLDRHHLYALIRTPEPEIWTWSRDGATAVLRTRVTTMMGDTRAIFGPDGISVSAVSDGGGALFDNQGRALPLRAHPGRIVGFVHGGLVVVTDPPNPSLQVLWSDLPASRGRAVGSLLLNLPTGPIGVTAVAEAPEGLLIGDSSGVIRLIELRTGAELDRWLVG